MEAINALRNSSKALSVGQTLKTAQNGSLSNYSIKDKPWDSNRGASDDVAMIYASAEGFEKYARRISECSGFLSFGWSDNLTTGESTLSLRSANFCRVRHCPVCQWRRSLMWQARFYQALPKIAQEHPKARWVFLTLTVRNMPVNELRGGLQAMGKAWQRLIKRKEFKQVLGWVRTTEVTRGKDGTAHPHYHAMLMVTPSYFTGAGYVKQLRWVELWGECLQVDYLPTVDVRAVKPRKPQAGQLQADANVQALQGAISETLKYAVKPDDMTTDETWFIELTKQVHKLRFVATGGVLKDSLKVEEETNQDLVLAGEPGIKDDGSRLDFSWRPSERKYKRTGF